MGLLKQTESLCPICLKKIPANIMEENNKIFLKKSCPDDGLFEDIYYGNAELYKRYIHSVKQQGHSLHSSALKNDNCPNDCGLCDYHKSSTVLANMDITNACNYHCPVCFADTASGNTVFNPSMEQISHMMDTLRAQNPPCSVLQFSGGEPTIRKDFFEIASLAHKKGFAHIQVATNGKYLAEKPDFAKKLWEARVATVYLQFDGVTPEPYRVTRGFDALPEKLKAIENLRNHGPYPNAVLVPTIVKGVNDHQIGDIIRFASDNIDIIRGVNFQPVSFTGRISTENLLQQRMTIPDVLSLLETQSEGQITPDDFFSIPIFTPLFELLKKVDPEGIYPDLYVHPACGAWTYAFKDGETLVPLNRMINIEAVFDLVASLKTISKTEILAKVTTHLPKVIRTSSLKYSHIIINVLKEIILKGSYRAASEFHDNSVLFIGSMHFMDPYNFDCERLERCCIHYITPDNKIIPFCSYNTLYREKYAQQYSRKNSVVE
jgi:7,8-dihydro-6-hydroxymethylpterin dimethyltransferase